MNGALTDFLRGIVTDPDAPAPSLSERIARRAAEIGRTGPTPLVLLAETKDGTK